MVKSMSVLAEEKTVPYCLTCAELLSQILRQFFETLAMNTRILLDSFEN